MPSAEIITIGTEILLGEIVDTNARHIARVLRTHGIDIYRTTSIGDNVSRIADAIQSSIKRSDIVITTGGLGPTVDDPTRDAVALAFGVETIFQEDLWQQVINRFARFDRYPTENNRKQAYIPRGATAIENPVGTAPAFMMKKENRVVFSLPGVPREMEYILDETVIPEIKNQFTLDTLLLVRILHTSGAGESQIDEKISDLEELRNPTVGLAAHSGQVDIRITAKAASIEAAEDLILPVESEIENRLGNWIFGKDKDTLASTVMNHLEKRGWNLAVVEAGLEGTLIQQIPTSHSLFAGGHYYPSAPVQPEQLQEQVRTARNAFSTDVVLGIGLYKGEKSEIFFSLLTPNEDKFITIPYGGPQKLAALRAANLGLNALRKL